MEEILIRWGAIVILINVFIASFAAVHIGLYFARKQKERNLMKEGRIEPMKGGHEYDALTKWRRVLCYLDRSGVAKKIKRKYNKRVRQAGKKEVRTETQ